MGEILQYLTGISTYRDIAVGQNNFDTGLGQVCDRIHRALAHGQHDQRIGGEIYRSARDQVGGN